MIARPLIPAFALIIAMAAAQDVPGDLAFEVASVRVNKTGSNLGTTNVPLGPGSVYTPTGGYLSIVNYPAMAFISFAYKVTGDQEQYLRAHLPAWVLSERFDIQARTAGNPTKDEMRLMMRSLLADRFKLVIRHETRQAAVYALLLTRQGKIGPELRQHPDGAQCVTTSSNDMAAMCGGLVPLPHGPGRIVKFGARNVTMMFIANQLSIMGQLGRPVIDRTGLSGNFDFSLGWSPESPNPQTEPLEPLAGPTFGSALSEQLGLKLSAETGPVNTLIVDHIERPAQN